MNAIESLSQARRSELAFAPPLLWTQRALGARKHSYHDDLCLLHGVWRCSTQGRAFYLSVSGREASGRFALVGGGRQAGENKNKKQRGPGGADLQTAPRRGPKGESWRILGDWGNQLIGESWRTMHGPQCMVDHMHGRLVADRPIYKENTHLAPPTDIKKLPKFCLRCM